MKIFVDDITAFMNGRNKDGCLQKEETSGAEKSRQTRKSMSL